MRKFLAVVKHEYKKVVLKWTFLIGTFLFPLFIVILGSVPAIIFSIKGQPTRIAIVDRSGKIGSRIKDNLSPEKIAARSEKAMNESMKNITNVDASRQEKMKRGSEQLSGDFVFIDYDAANKDINAVRNELTGNILDGNLDAYLIVPENVNSLGAVFEFRTRRGGDFVAGDSFKIAVNDAVRSQRLADANISEDKLAAINEPVNLDEKGLNEKGEEKDATGVFVASFGIGLMIYITLAIYGQAIMGAVVEEKETRIAEDLFSSATPFQLMMGKLVGVGLAGITQLSIWMGSVAVFLGIAATQVSLTELLGSLPVITPVMFIEFLVFFLLGFFIYASIFALIGAMVTSVQEGGQFAFPPVMILLVGFYFSFAVVRDPNSDLSFWVSIAPFFAPITMPVRILAETPPFWQILLSFAVNGLAIAGLVWITARVYRVGMLMYGKRATIPEVWKWVRQSIAMAIETEKKYRLPVSLIETIKERLKSANANFVGSEHEENIIYRGGVLDQTGAIIRIRKTDEKILLTYKRRTDGYGDVKRQIENECEVSDAAAIEAILLELALTPRLIYEKNRETWTFRAVEIVIDELPFGWFIEVEGSLTAITEAEMLLDLDELETVHETYPLLTANLGVKKGELIEARFE